MKTFNEKLLFVGHVGTVSGEPGTLMFSGCALPVAFSHPSWGDDIEGGEDGLQSLWESTGDADEFFGYLCLSSFVYPNEGGPGGLWVYEVNWTEDDYNPEDVEEDEAWWWLTGGKIRRPNLGEISSFTEGKPPWKGVWS